MASNRSSFRLASLAVFSLLVVATVGCKPGAQDLCERYAKAQCRFHYGCCNATERARLGQGFGSAHYNEETCVEELTKTMCSLLSAYADAEQQGRAVWNHEQANTCLGDMEAAAASCDAGAMLGGNGLADECALESLVTGAVEDEGTCYQSFECENDEAVCVENEPEEEDEQLVTEKGTCTPPPGIGDECPDYVCSQAGWCDTTEDPPVCKAKKPNGDACDSPLECESTVCDFSNGAGECAPKKPIGSTCFIDSECGSEFCDDVASECAAPREDGEPCTKNAGCESAICDFNTGQCAGVDDENVTYDICSAEEQ